jgi:ribosomal-protein-alanine N-acetyltransferase
MLIQHKGTNTIETIRLILRRFTLEDAQDMFYNWASDPEVCKYLSWGPHSDVEVSRKRIMNWIGNYSYQNSYVWAIELKSKNMVIGSISVELSNDSAMSCEVGYCIGKLYWSRGIMTEALRAVMHYLFYEIGYQRIQAKHDVLNTASGKVMQKAGMKYVKTEFRSGVRRDGTYYDCAVYSKSIADD